MAQPKKKPRYNNSTTSGEAEIAPLSTALPILPSFLIARILTYNVTTTVDVARLRLVGKKVGQQAIRLLSVVNNNDDDAVAANRSKHFIRCPGRRIGSGDISGSFVERLCAFDWDPYKQRESLLVGDVFDCMGCDLSLLARAAAIPESDVTVRVLGLHQSIPELTTCHPSISAAAASSLLPLDDESRYLSELKTVCEAIVKHATTTSYNDFLDVAVQATPFVNPSPGSTKTAAEELFKRQARKSHPYPFFHAMSAMVSFEIDVEKAYVKRAVKVHDGDIFYQLQLVKKLKTERFNRNIPPTFQPLFPGGLVWAVDAGPAPGEDNDLRVVHVLMHLLCMHDDRIIDILRSETFFVSSLWKEHQNHKLVEGVAVVDDVLSEQFRRELSRQVDALAQKQQRDHAADNSHSLLTRGVRDILTPALYSYIEDVSPWTASLDDVEPCQLLPNWPVNQEPDEDFWGRLYTSSKYQWLPSYVNISNQGKCTFETYINNLTPRTDPIHSALYTSLETLLDHALPYMESVLSYTCAIRPSLRNQDDSDGFKYNDQLVEFPLQNVSLRGQKLQVITNIVDYELTTQHDSHEGMWHVQGISYEEIVLTCLYILNRDDTIHGGDIEFKRAFVRDELEYIVTKLPETHPPHIDSLVKEGLVPLGTVATPAGRLIVFPNSHVHRIKLLKLALQDGNNNDDNNDPNADGGNCPDVVAKRRIVVFFVVNPQRRIVSTREVAPQQIHSGGKLPHDEALKHSLAFMAERKDMKQDWNVRHFDLDDHYFLHLVK